MKGCSETEKNEQYMLYGSDKLNKFNYPNDINGILDNGASGNFITTTTPQTAIKHKHTALAIKQSDGNNLVSEQKSELNIFKELSTQAREVYVFNKIIFPLISVAKLCDDGCAVVF